MYNSKENITAEELFGRVGEIIEAQTTSPECVNRMMHEALVLTCREGLSDNRQAFGNLFAQVDFLCKRCRISSHDAMAIQKMRRDSNRSALLLSEEVAYDCRALCILISAVFQTDIPSTLVGRIPAVGKLPTNVRHIDYRYLRCIVQAVSEGVIEVEADTDAAQTTLRVDISDEQWNYLRSIICIGTQLNLLDSTRSENGVLLPRRIIFEPDFLIDISSIARCFTDYGHHPLAYTVNRMAPAANSQAILLGHFAGSSLDDVIHQGTAYNWTTTFRNSFKEKALAYSTCPDLNRKADFRTAAVSQARNIQEIVTYLFTDSNGPNRERTVLEPSFVCEELGIQGRVDLMTTDFRLLVEQKSGSNYNIQRGFPNAYGSFQKEDHYVQLLLYYGVLQHNFRLGRNRADTYLLYSKYPLPGGLVSVNYYDRLFNEAIQLRNLLVAYEFAIARTGFENVIDRLSPETLNERHCQTKLFQQFQLPQIEAITAPLHRLSLLERAYFCRMMTFVYREQAAAKLGVQEGIGNSSADLWTMPLAEKRETGNIYTDLCIVKKERSNAYNGFDTITLAVPNQGEDFLPNFRQGDMVYLYACDGEPDVRKALLYKGVMARIEPHTITVHLNDGQQNEHIFDLETPSMRYAIEHSSSDISTNSAIRSLHSFITTTPDRKALLLGQRGPQRDPQARLTRSYHPDYDEILLKAKQARDYFLLVGPPGTGKTSMALRFIVEEALNSSDGCAVLLMAYTNRAIDEICAMLCAAELSFVRIGNEFSCDERFRPYLIDRVIDDCPKLETARQRIHETTIFVGTTSAMLSHTNIFQLKHFSLAVIDEASQILEPAIIGLLAAHSGPDENTPTLIDRFILIGDHKQLPAVVQQDAAVSKVDDPLLQAIGIDNCRQSLFERLIKWERAQGREAFVGVLRKQGRMHPDVADFPSRMFYHREQLQPVPCPHQTETSISYALPSLDALDDALKTHRVLFIPSQSCRQTALSDKVNTAEARITALLLQRIHRFYGPRFDTQRTVGIIVPYRNQIAMIRKEIGKLGIKELLSVSIDTVERYQGSQRDVIIYSFTIQNRYQLDFLTANCFEEDDRLIDRKLNVALTRARLQMLMTGHVPTLAHNRIFKQLIDDVKSKGGYLPL